MHTNSTIIPIASGKGGVGKTMLTANLAMALAKAGHQTVAVDLDLGGSNLHTHLGIPNKHPGIGDFLKGRHVDFDDLLLPTETKNLRFIPGDGKTPFMANIPFEQRKLLIGEIKKIKARYVLLDLGAGSNFNTLNFFGLANRSIIISTFETAAIMNFLMFLRNFMFRLLTSAFRKNPEVFAVLTNLFKQSIRDRPLTVAMVMDKMATLDPALTAETQRKLQFYRPRIVFNMGETPDDLKICQSIDKSLQAYLALQPEFFGFIFHDASVRKAARNNKPLLSVAPDCLAARGITALAESIITNWDHYQEDSAATLLTLTRDNFDKWQPVA